MGTRGSFPGVKRLGREADHSPPSSVAVKNAWIYASTPQYAFMAWCSVKAQEQFYLYIYETCLFKLHAILRLGTLKTRPVNPLGIKDGYKDG
jgi:hypothetical protein